MSFRELGLCRCRQVSNQPTTRIIGPTSPPGLQDILNSVISQIAANTSCAKVGTIQSYNAVLNTCEVTISSKVELTDGRVFDYPPLVDCPVYKLQGGTAFLSMPILKGDTCLVVFNDFDIDNWFYQGDGPVPPGPPLPATSRKHSLADGMVFVGFNNLTNVTPALSGIAELCAGINKLALGNTAISLKYIIDTLFNILQSATVQVGATAYPFTAATIAQLGALHIQANLLLDKGSSAL